MNQFLRFTALALPFALLAACTSPEDPQATICQKMAGKIAGKSDVQWDAPKRTETSGDELKVELFSPDLNATCMFARQPEAPDSGAHTLGKTGWETAPSSMTVNGAPVDMKTFAKALMDATGKMFATSVKETDQILQEKAAQAQGQLEEAAAKAAEKIREMQNK